MAINKVICLSTDPAAVCRERVTALAETLSATAGREMRVRGRTLEETSQVARRAHQGQVRVLDPLPVAMLSVWADLPQADLVDVVSQHVEGTRAVHVAETVQMQRRSMCELAGYVVRVGFIVRNPEITRAEFATHWVEGHGPLVIEHGPLFDRYVNNVPSDPTVTFDGMVEQYFADRDVWERHDEQVARRKAEVAQDADTFTAGLLQMVGRDVSFAIAGDSR